jgi:hypothetical protein
VGAIVLGVMLGVVGISWFKSHCLPDEKEGHKGPVLFFLLCFNKTKMPASGNELINNKALSSVV